MLNTGFDISKNLFKDFSSKVSSNKNYLQNAYGKRKLYYNDIIKEENKKKKNSKLTKISAYIGTTIALLATAGLIINNRFPANSADRISSNAKLSDKITNISGNIMNIKDDLWDRFVSRASNFKPLSWLKKSGDFITHLYKKAIKNTLRGNYDKLYNQYIQNGGNNPMVQDFDTWFSRLDENVNLLVHKDKRLSKGIIKKGFFNKFINTHFANEKMGNNVFNESILPDFTTGGNVQIENLKNEQEKLLKILVPKLRDINLGSAPTDVLTILASAVGLGSAVVHSENVENKKSVMVNLGIPIISSLALTVFGTLRCLTGATSLLIGLAVGNFASQIARITDDVILNANKKTPD